MLNKARQQSAKILVILISLVLLDLPVSNCYGETVLFQDDFGSGNADRWQLESGWKIEKDAGNFVLSGSTHTWATIGNFKWQNFRFKSKVKLLDPTSGVHINYRINGCNRYFVGFNPEGLYLNKTYPCTSLSELNQVSENHNVNQWYGVEIVGNAGNIKVYVDDVLKFDFTDNAPVTAGSVAFEVLSEAPVFFDDIQVTTDEPVAQFPWKSTGGPLGGLGYDVRIHPTDKNVMYVTDNWAGVLKSTNAGQTWSQNNSGITVKGGTTGDAVNIFSLTIDPNNPNIVWAGTFGEGSAYGVFKSTDGGATWVKKTKGIALGDDSREVALVFRGFTIQNGNSDVVYAQAEVSTTIQGYQFNRVKGRAFKTTDGGENWQLVWQGNDLARYLIIDPSNPAVLYLSAGLFDREAFNSDCQNYVGGGEGVLKSINGGQSWFPVTTGLTDLYVGSLRMHPTNSQILFAATGNDICSRTTTGNHTSGLFMTTNGGSLWVKVIPNEVLTTVNISKSDPNVVYAGSQMAFYRSRDGGSTWSKHQWPNQRGFGPRGTRAGFPIDVIVDPDIPTTLYVNNYGGGVIRSLDGAETWNSWSKGYSGADIHLVHIPENIPSTVYAIGRSGPFASYNLGVDWVGIGNGDATYSELNAITTSPADSQIVLLSDEHQGVLLRSTDGGLNFKEIFRHSATDASNPNKRQGYKGLAFAPSSPNVVYAGLSKDRGTFLTSSSIGTVVYKSQDSGLTFSPIPSILDGHNVRKLVIAQNDANTVYAATTNGVYKTSNGGTNWVYFGSLGSRKIEALAIDPQKPGYIIAGEIFGGIWVSNDDGATWSGPLNSGFNSPNPYITSLALDPVDSDAVFAGDLYSGIYRSLDRGNTWTSFPDWKMSGLSMRAVKDIAVSKKVMYAATQGGGVFRFDRLYGLTVAKEGSGFGSISSSPVGIDCGNICTSDLTPGTSVTLTATPALGSEFNGWTGGLCIGTGNCVVAMDQAINVIANFSVKTKPGDCDNSGTVSIAEVQSSINMFLGLKSAEACVDQDGAGGVSIAEVQKVINSFLGL
jgi:photosystem II stability/assembly factor-like uncharacterized protein